MSEQPKTAGRILLPAGWPQPRGYAHAVMAQGQTIYLAGQIGWTADGRFPEGLAAQVEQSLRNILAVLEAADAGPRHIVRMTWFLTSIADYEASLVEIGQAWRRVMGKCFPAMSVVQVVRLVEARALVEIEATAVL